MARVYQALNENRLKVEAYIEAEMEQAQAYEAKRSKKRPLVVGVCILLIVAVAAALLFAFFGPGVFGSITGAVQDTLRAWAEDMRLSYDEVENGDYEGELGERLLSGIGGFFLSILRGLGALLLDLVALVSPLLVIAVLLGAGFGILWGCLLFLSEFGLRAPTQEQLRERIIRWMDKEMKDIVAGLEGEEAALAAVSSLDDGCSVFENLNIWLDGKHNETDLITVTPSGLTVIEVKNYGGTLLGDLSQEQLIQRRYKKRGKFKDDEAGNPVQQIQAPVEKLEAVLARKGIQVPVRRCVIFTNENVDLQLTDREGLARNCPLFILGTEGLAGYLHSPARETLDREQMCQLVSVLKSFL